MAGRKSDRGEQLKGRNMNGISFQHSVYGYRFPQTSGRPRLRIETEDLPRRVVKQNQLRPGRILHALIRFGKSLFGGAAAINNDARPCSRGLLSERYEINKGKKYQREYPP